MKALTKIAAIAGLGLVCAMPAHSAILNDWYFNPDGTGVGTARQINEYLDITGNAFVQLTPTGGSNFDFAESGVFQSLSYDGGPSFGAFNNEITATFTASGSGTFGGAFSFDSGLINIFVDPLKDYATTTSVYGADNGTPIAQFEVFGGGGSVEANGEPTANGQITIYARLVSMAAGYFFDPLGNDLSTGDVLAFAFTNANTIGSPNATMVSEIICQGAGFTGDGCNGNPYANNAPSYFFIGNNGQFKLATVPEPGVLVLLGLGLLGLSVTRRRAI